MTPSARELLLRAVGEEELTRHVKLLGRRGGWCGAHTRYSEGVIESIHTRRADGHSCAFGMPDWIFVNEQPGLPFRLVELKSARGRQDEDQKRWQRMIEAARGVVFDLWRPMDEDAIRAALLGPSH